MAQLRVTHDHIARTFACARATITRLVGRFRQTGQKTDRARSGRPLLADSPSPKSLPPRNDNGIMTLR